jgi:hypothetical protein
VVVWWEDIVARYCKSSVGAEREITDVLCGFSGIEVFGGGEGGALQPEDGMGIRRLHVIHFGCAKTPGEAVGSVL